MKRIACIGEAMIELSLAGEAAQVGVAGDTLNTAIYLHRAAPDLQVDYITCLGDDPLSDRIEAFIADQGVGTVTVKRLPGASPGLYAISTSETGERSFTYWRSTSAARRLFEDLNFELLEDYDAIYLSGISMAILPASVRQALIDWLARSEVTLIYDSNHRPRLWEDPQTARETNAALWSRADIALPSLDDEMVISGESAEEVAARFLATAKQGALKRGELGPLSLGEAVTQDYAPALEVRDTTAAGDSFNAGYLAAVFAGLGQGQALAAGHALASEVVQHRGAIITQDSRG